MVQLLSAKDVTIALWQVTKWDFPEKHRKMREAIRQYGKDRVKFSFDENFKPMEIEISC